MSAPGGSGPSLRVRIFGAMALVVLAGAGTLMIVSLVVAPGVFYRHLERAGVAQDPTVTTHVADGFALATVVSTVVGVVIAGAVAAAMALLVSRRIATPVTTAADAAGRLAAGDYSAHVNDPRMGPELADLSTSVNALAARLLSTEQDRLRLMADLAHQLRTPMASITATVEAITDGILPADNTTLATLTDNATLLSRLIDDLSLVSRAQERAFLVDSETVDLTALARTVSDAARARFTGTGVDLTMTPAQPVYVRADPDRIGEVIGQLLDNALQHTHPGDSVDLAISRRDDEADLTITDTGEGFHAEEAEAIFGRFYRATSVTDSAGSGIGLTIARAVVNAHGGTITAHSPGLGRGASFTVSLPAQPMRPASPGLPEG
jgi:signal transduction histidine kinase